MLLPYTTTSRTATYSRATLASGPATFLPTSTSMDHVFQWSHVRLALTQTIIRPYFLGGAEIAAAILPLAPILKQVIITSSDEMKDKNNMAVEYHTLLTIMICACKTSIGM